MTETKENCRKQTGNLKINNKLYPIYEGLNIIGRDAKSTIILKETIFSKLHAAISVVDANTHLICDLNSTNGTQLGKLKLIPYKFYSIKDYEPIIFGDVVAMYFKGTELQNNCVIKSLQNVDHDASTQIINNLNNTVENIHELPTQVFSETNCKTGLNIHEAPTQIFPENKSESFNIHEAPTQIFPETNNVENIQLLKAEDDLTSKNNSSKDIDDSDDDATQDLDPLLINTQNNDEDVLSHTDVYDDIFANESFRSSLEKSAAEIVAVEVDETVLVEFKKPENSESKTVVGNNDEMSDDDDDIILSTQDSEAIDQKYREHQEEMNSTMDKMDEKIIEEVSDSDVTDVEDEQLLVNVAQTSKVPETPEIMDVVNEEIVENNVDDDVDSDENDIDLLASTTSKSESHTEEAELASTQLITTTTTITTKEINNSFDDELPATQLLHSNKDPKENHVFLAPRESAEKTSEELPDVAEENTTEPINLNEEAEKIDGNQKDDIFSAATQMLPPEIVETNKTSENKCESDSIHSAETQFFPPENIEDKFVAATQILPPENIEDRFEAATQILLPENIEDKFEAATQILPPETTDIKDNPADLKSKTTVENEEENIFEAATQILEIQENPKATENEVQNDEDNIFSAPTQLILHPENEAPNEQVDDIFLAPTQILEDESLKKTDDSIRLSSESNDESMRLHLSETEPSLTNMNIEFENEKLLQQQQNTETQLEVSFELETQKLYIEEKTRRPDNPLSHLFAEETTQMTEQCGDTIDNEDLNTSIESISKLTPIISVVDIKKSKITLKDIQEASTSKIKKSYVKLERIKTEPTRRSNRNAKIAENEKFTTDCEISEEAAVETLENAKTTKRKTKLVSNESSTSKVSEKQDTVINGENGMKEEKTTRRRTKLISNEISEKQEVKTPKRRLEITSFESENTNVESTKKVVKTSSPIKEIKDVGDKKPTSKTKLSKKTEESQEKSEETDFKTSSSRHNTRGRRRDYKSIANGELESINESKNAKGRITSKSFMREKIEELEIHVKEEKTKRSAAKSEEIDSDDSVFKSKRSKRNNSQEKEVVTVEDSDASSIEINIRSKVQKNEPKRNRKQMDSEENKEIKNNVRRNRRTTQTVTNKDADEKPIEIEDSDESILETCRQEKSGRTIQTRKRNIEISPERNKTVPYAGDIYTNTPNSKRRRYEPLCVNISSSVIGAPEHKVVFTMLNDTNLETIVQKLGGSVVDSIHTCTVLVTNKISRSLKFLIAVALGKPIVHLKWILDSEKRKQFLDPWDYLLEDTESEAKFQMSLKESLTKSRSEKLMSGETILLAAAKNFDVLKEIIETSGGKCITRAPPKNNKAVVVCYEDEKSKYSRYLKQKTLIVVSAEAIFSGVLQQKLNWKQYILS